MQEKLEEICSSLWEGYRDWTFQKWWAECREDLWCYIKRDPDKVLTSTKVKTSGFWYEKNQGVQKIYADMQALCEKFMGEWKKSHPEPEEQEVPELDEDEVLGKLAEVLV